MLNIFNNKIVLSLTHKLSFIFAILYLIIFRLSFTIEEMLLYLSLSIVVIFGIGGIGYLINDFTDIEQDKAAGKANIFETLHSTAIVFIGLLCMLAASLPWIIFPFTKASLGFLCTELLLFSIYSFHPFRLKEKGIAGLIVDALYAHLVPIVFAVYTFTLVKAELVEFEIYFYTGLIWVFLVGVRNIIKHQIEDYDNDIKSNTETLVQRFDLKRLRIRIIRFMIPFETVLFLTTLLLIDKFYGVIVVIFVAYSILYYLRRKKELWIEERFEISALFNFLNERILNEFYERWLGLLIILLGILMTGNLYLGFILVMHIIIFHKILLAK